MDKKNRNLNIFQWVFGVYFIMVGVMHFIVPEGLPSVMEWMYDLDDSMHIIAGSFEILGGLGLILPSLTGIRPELTWMAFGGLAVLMIGAAGWHVPRSEVAQVVQDLFFAGILGYLAMQRRANPIPAKQAAAVA